MSSMMGPPVDKQEAMPVLEETHWVNVVMRPCGRAQLFLQIGPTQSPICIPRAPIRPVSLPAEAMALIRSPAPPRGPMAIVACWNTPEPPQPDPKHPTEMMAIGAMAPSVFHMHASQVVRDDSTGSVYLDTITASIERMVIGGPDIDDPATSPTTEVVTRWE